MAKSTLDPCTLLQTYIAVALKNMGESLISPNHWDCQDTDLNNETECYFYFNRTKEEVEHTAHKLCEILEVPDDSFQLEFETETDEWRVQIICSLSVGSKLLVPIKDEDTKMYEYEGVEWCPYCEAETEYKRNTNDSMIGTCSCCGRPIVLCDFCDAKNGHNGQYCGDGCGACKEVEKLRKEWEKTQVGRIVKWIDPTIEGASPMLCGVVSVDECNWELRATNGAVIKCCDDEIDFKVD